MEIGVETRIKEQKGSFGLCRRVVAAEETLPAAVGAPGRCPGGALSLAGVLLPEVDLCHMETRGLWFRQRVIGITLGHLVSKGAGHDFGSLASACLSGFGRKGGTRFTPDPPEVSPYTSDGHCQLIIGKSGDGMFFLSFTFPLGSLP